MEKKIKIVYKMRELLENETPEFFLQENNTSKKNRRHNNSNHRRHNGSGPIWW